MVERQAGVFNESESDAMRGRPDRKRTFLLSLVHPGMLQSSHFKSFFALCSKGDAANGDEC